MSLADAAVEFVQPDTLAAVLLDGLAKAALFVMIASGLSLIFGLMGVLNFAHGSLTMIGAYLGGLVMVTVAAGSSGFGRLAMFAAAALFVFVVLSAFGSAVEATLIRPLYDRPLYQILLTFGVALVLEELVRIALLYRGMQPRSEWQAAIGSKPAMLERTYAVAGIGTTGLELFEILMGVLVVATIWTFLTRTRYGLIIRAGSEDSEMVSALGIDVRRAFTVVFGLGVGLAGLAGALLMWDPRWGASVPLAMAVLLPSFVVVIVGGLGSFRGTVVAGIIVGLVDAAMTWWFTNA
ncbi:MAG: branched-chain amino acid ABC transporter permease, partial [Halobacteriales archaeon]